MEPSKIFLTSTISESAKDIGRKLKAKTRKLKTLFITTPADAEDGDKQWLIDDKNALIKAGFILSDYTIVGKTKSQIEKDLSETDVIYMSGGDTFYLLYQMQRLDVKETFINAVKQGKIYIGTSAGSIIAAPDIWPIYRLEAEEWRIKVTDNKGLGLVDFIIFPHWGSDHFKDRYLNYRLEHAYNTDNQIILLNDYQYVEILEKGYQIVDVRKQ